MRGRVLNGRLPKDLGGSDPCTCEKAAEDAANRGEPILAEEACRFLADHCGRKAGYEEDGANADAFIGELAWGNDGRLGRGPLRVGAHKGGCSITAIVSFSLLSYVARCLSAPTVKKSAAKAWAS